MLRAEIEVAETLKARAEGDFSYEPKDNLLVAAQQAPVDPPKASPHPEQPPVTPPAPAAPPFS